MFSKTMHKTADILIKRGHNPHEACSMTVAYFDEVLRLYPGLSRSPAKIAEKISIAAYV